jgi:hypothetical protein
MFSAPDIPLLVPTLRSKPQNPSLTLKEKQAADLVLRDIIP